MRKILISILIILLIVLAYFTIFQGISLGTFKISSVKEIIELNDELKAKIEETNSKIKNVLKSKETELSNNVDTLLKNKEDYYKLANVSTESEINKANTEEIYNTEFLFLKIGRHARKEGVILNMPVKTGTTGDPMLKDLSFTVIGKYYGIIDFVSALENDSDLNFRIDDFKMVAPGENLQATFNVRNVRIKIENTTQNVTSTTENATENATDDTTDDTTNDTNSVAQ